MGMAQYSLQPLYNYLWNYLRIYLVCYYSMRILEI